MPRTSRKRARESSPEAGSEPHQVRTKLSAFEERYDTTTKSNEDVLSKSQYFQLQFRFFDTLFPPYGIPTQELDLSMLSPLQGACYNCGEWSRQVPIYMSHVCLYISFLFAHSISRGNRNPSIVLTHKCEEDSTTNLVHHVKSCKGQVVDQSKSIANYAQGSTYTKAELRYLVSHWVFECHRPFSIIDDTPLQHILKMLYAKVETPSQTTLSWDVKEIHAISKVHVGRYLQVCLSYNFSFLQT